MQYNAMHIPGWASVFCWPRAEIQERGISQADSFLGLTYILLPAASKFCITLTLPRQPSLSPSNLQSFKPPPSFPYKFKPCRKRAAEEVRNRMQRRHRSPWITVTTKRVFCQPAPWPCAGSSRRCQCQRPKPLQNLATIRPYLQVRISKSNVTPKVPKRRTRETLWKQLCFMQQKLRNHNKQRKEKQTQLFLLPPHPMCVA